MKHTNGLQRKGSEVDTNMDQSEFLVLQESPNKKQSFQDTIGDDQCDMVEVLEFNKYSTSLNCKVEKMTAASIQNTVSHRKKKKR